MIDSPQFLLNQTEGRQGLVALIVASCEEAGADVLVVENKDDYTLMITGAGLSATVEIWTIGNGGLSIRWKSDELPLRAVEGAWSSDCRENFRTTHAITNCESQSHLIEALATGLKAAVSGVAFGGRNIK